MKTLNETDTKFTGGSGRLQNTCAFFVLSFPVWYELEFFSNTYAIRNSRNNKSESELLSDGDNTVLE